jgi:hypothetical protein
MRDPHSIGKLAERIVTAIDGEPSVWRKWEGKREALARAAVDCWVPVEDLQSFLNAMPGPRLTLTDVAQRLRAMHEEPYSSYPNEDVREGCRSLYEREKALGTELPAIIWALREFIEDEEGRLYREREAMRHRRIAEEKAALEQRFLSGADCKWTTLANSRDLYIRKNGRAYRLSPTKDKRWHLYRIETVDGPGSIIGTYGTRGDANRVLAKIAYDPEPRW